VYSFRGFWTETCSDDENLTLDDPFYAGRKKTNPSVVSKAETALMIGHLLCV